MFDTKKFGAGATKVDKYGRKIEESKGSKDTESDFFFKEDASDNDSESSRPVPESKPNQKQDSSIPAKRPKKKLEEPEEFHWSAESSSEGEPAEGEDDLHELLGEKVIEYDFLTDEEAVEMREISSKRLALMNYD